MKRRLIAFSISFLILAYLLYTADIARVLEEMQKLNPFVYALAFMITFLDLSSKTLRWKIMLRELHEELPFRPVFRTMASGIFLSSLTPGRSGEPVRAYLLKKEGAKSFTKVMPTIVVERILDIIVILMFAVLGSFFFPLPAGFTPLLIVSILFVLCATVLVISFCLSRRIFEGFWGILMKVFGGFAFVKKREKDLPKFLDNFYTGLSVLKSGSVMAKTFMLTILSWGFGGLIIVLVSSMLGFELNILSAVFIFSVSTLVGLASFLPGGLGSAEAVMAYLLTFILPDLPTATALTLLFRFSTLYFTCFLGSLFLFMRFRK